MAIDFSMDIPAADVIPQERIPQRTLNTGAKMPAMGLGTFNNDRFSFEDIGRAVYGALRIGYRLIDCAAAYRNEKEIGQALAQAQKDGISRESMFITSKLWNDKHRPEDVIPTLKQTLSDLQLDYLDAYYIHWPFRNTHAPGAQKDDRHPDSRPYCHERYMETYRELEKAVDLGLIRHIGTSNMTRVKLEQVLRDARIRPAMNQMEMHPAFAQPEFFAYLRAEGIQPVAFSPLGSPTRPDRDRDEADVPVLQQPAIVEIAKKHGIHPAVVCVKWAVQRGQTPIPFSVYYNEYHSNLKSVTEDPLSEEEMRKIEAVDTNCRLIKGVVFLWEGAKSWKALWDEE